MNEKLSGNVLRNWDRFVDGLQDVTIIQGDIEVLPAVMLSMIAFCKRS